MRDLQGGKSIPRLHLITDTVLQTRYSHLDLVRMAVEAGVDAVQVREKHWDPLRHPAELEACVRAAEGSRTKIIVNDHVQAALVAGAHGVHMGQDDATPTEARALLGAGAIVGATVHNLDELALIGAETDYIGVGPVFGTRSKQLGLPPLGTAGLHKICNLSPVPVVAIGSVDASNAAAVLQAGAYGIALISAFVLSPDPRSAARRLQQLVDDHPWPVG